MYSNPPPCLPFHILNKGYTTKASQRFQRSLSAAGQTSTRRVISLPRPQTTAKMRGAACLREEKICRDETWKSRSLISLAAGVGQEAMGSCLLASENKSAWRTGYSGVSRVVGLLQVRRPVMTSELPRGYKCLSGRFKNWPVKGWDLP